MHAGPSSPSSMHTSGTAIPAASLRNQIKLNYPYYSLLSLASFKFFGTEAFSRLIAALTAPPSF